MLVKLIGGKLRRRSVCTTAVSCSNQSSIRSSRPFVQHTMAKGGVALPAGVLGLLAAIIVIGAPLSAQSGEEAVIQGRTLVFDITFSNTAQTSLRCNSRPRNPNCAGKFWRED